ncbi:MAG TPA: glycosyltransferase [Vicinamibacterales bacterium]|nr:glycosyltransferase [Vicinamibacterales bacterium]
MATAIREVELSLPLEDIAGIGGCQRCMLVFRWRGVVVGRAFIRVEGGVLSRAEVAHSAAQNLTPAATRVWLEDLLQFDERGVPAEPVPSAAVAICTRERPEDLMRTLAAVCALHHRPAEIIVVDNAPATAGTRDVVARFPAARYVVEPGQGLNRARNRALREATADVVAFTDDDAAPETAWLGALLLNFRDPRVTGVTGLTLPAELQTPAQELFEEHCSFVRGFARRVFDGRVDHPLGVSKIGAGANMAVRRAAAQSIGWFDERLDAGTPTRSGGDHEFFTRVLAAGHRIVYEPRAVSWHRHRRTLDELLDVVRGYGTGVYAMWTGRLLESRDLGVLRLAWRWFVWDHWPVLRSPRRLMTDGDPRDRLRRAEFKGCLAGPAAWVKSAWTRHSVA